LFFSTTAKHEALPGGQFCSPALNKRAGYASRTVDNPAAA